MTLGVGHGETAFVDARKEYVKSVSLQTIVINGRHRITAVVAMAVDRWPIHSYFIMPIKCEARIDPACPAALPTHASSLLALAGIAHPEVA